MYYLIQLIINLLQFISNMPQLMWSCSRTINDKVCSDMGIFNGSFVDHSWICLLDRASGYVDKSFQKNNVHYRLWRLQGVPAHCNYRSIALPRRFAGFARSPVCGEHCFFWSLSLQVIFDSICRTSWTYGHIRSTLHMFISIPQGSCIQTTGKVWLSPVVSCFNGKVVNWLASALLQTLIREIKGSLWWYIYLQIHVSDRSPVTARCALLWPSCTYFSRASTSGLLRTLKEV